MGQLLQTRRVVLVILQPKQLYGLPTANRPAGYAVRVVRILPAGGEGVGMGANIAICSRRHPGGASLNNFHDEIAEELRFESDTGLWIILARVVLRNYDGDQQDATAKLVHGRTMLDVVRLGLPDRSDVPTCVFLQAPVMIRDKSDTVTLQCSTYDGGASDASIFAFDVGHVHTYDGEWADVIRGD